MMTSSKVREYLEAKPFMPFRFKMASGQLFEVRHPEMIIVSKTSVRIYSSPEPNSNPEPNWHDVSLLLMETLQPIISPTTEH